MASDECKSTKCPEEDWVKKESKVIRRDGMVCYEQEIEKDEPPKFTELSTCPPDPRFQQQNKTKWCYRMFIDYHRCVHLLGEDGGHCDIFKKCYLCLCPKFWIESWEEQIGCGTFPRDLTSEMG
ncbi:uncharacterized protein [Halyomorpha halys]|uniref:uncharacterized protein n=1 Tax=Halyomorpha halys TaxID=286706 RepID=UPI0006D4DFE8|nr:cytochrome c oxidase subunit 6b-3 [Halyomorpha halys]